MRSELGYFACSVISGFNGDAVTLTYESNERVNNSLLRMHIRTSKHLFLHSNNTQKINSENINKMVILVHPFNE